MKKATQALQEKSALGSAWVVVTCPATSRILLGKRSKDANNPGQWNLFGGGIDKGETAIQTALRELIEEAGVVVPEIDLRRLGSAPGNLTIFALELSPEQAKSAIRLNRAEVAKVKWFDLDDLPSNLHKSAIALLHVIESHDMMTVPTTPSMRGIIDMVEKAAP